jgi:hypothetical protein
MNQNIRNYNYFDADTTWSCGYLWPIRKEMVEPQAFADPRAK